MIQSENINDIIAAVAAGEMTVEQAGAAAQRLLDKAGGFTDLGYARADIARKDRQGAGEVIYGAGKTAEQIAGIGRALIEAGQEHVLITHLDADKAAFLDEFWGTEAPFEYHEVSRIGIIGGCAPVDGDGTIAVVSAGTSDEYVAEEAALTAEFLGNEVVRFFDVGVSGIHRVMSCSEELSRARVVIVVAGMEGALASVVGGMVSSPVIAVPTGVGYGASFGGVSALLAMLNSCASGVSVVNIDNGFGAGFQASLINHLDARQSDSPETEDRESSGIDKTEDSL